MCRHACPVGHVTHRETYTPHAWALTIESVKRGQLRWNDESVRRAVRVRRLRAVPRHCVTDQPLPDAIVAARAEIVAAGAAPSIVGEIERRLRAHANPYSGDTPTLAGRPAATVLFVGDVAAFQRPAAVDSALRLLRAAGIDALPICRGRSNGGLASTLGLREVAKTLAAAVVDEVRAVGAKDVVVLSAADRWTFEHVFPVRLDVSWPENVRVIEVTDVLAEALADGRLKLESNSRVVNYAYHDPCHAPRLGRDGQAARALLAAVAGSGAAHTLFWRESRAHPCGAIGGLEFTHPEIAEQLASSRAADAAAAGARLLIADDPACTAHLSAHAGTLPVAGLYELVAETL